MPWCSVKQLACSSRQGDDIEDARGPPHDPQGSGQALQGPRSIIQWQAAFQVSLNGFRPSLESGSTVPVPHSVRREISISARLICAHPAVQSRRCSVVWYPVLR